MQSISPNMTIQNLNTTTQTAQFGNGCNKSAEEFQSCFQSHPHAKYQPKYDNTKTTWSGHVCNESAKMCQKSQQDKTA